MATIANLVVEIQAKGTKLTRGLKKALGSIGKFTKDAAKRFAKLGGIITAAFAGITLATVAIINKQAAAIDNLAKKSSALGITVVALQRMKFAAEQSGVGMESLTNAFRRLARGVGEAKMGMGPAKKALEFLGLEAENLSKMSLDEQFAAVSKELAKVKDRATQGAIASQVFGRDWLPILNLVNADVEKLGKEFDSFGIGITQSQAKAVESFNDSKNALSTIFDGFLKQVTAEVAPAFDSIVKKIIASVKAMGGLKQVARDAAAFIIGLTINGINGIQGLNSAVTSLIIKFKQLQLAAANVAGFASFLSDTFGSVTLKDPRLENASSVLALEKQIFDLRKSQASSSPALEGLKSNLSQIQGSLKPKLAVEVTVKSDGVAIVEDVKVRSELDRIMNEQITINMKNSARQFSR